VLIVTSFKSVEGITSLLHSKQKHFIVVHLDFKKYLKHIVIPPPIREQIDIIKPELNHEGSPTLLSIIIGSVIYILLLFFFVIYIHICFLYVYKKFSRNFNAIFRAFD